MFKMVYNAALLLVAIKCSCLQYSALLGANYPLFCPGYSDSTSFQFDFILIHLGYISNEKFGASKIFLVFLFEKYLMLTKAIFI